MHMNEILKPLSTDANGQQVNTDIVQRTYDVFVQLDKDKSGTIDVYELTDAINTFSDKIHVTHKQSADIIRLCSNNDTNRKDITFSEFFHLYCALNVLIQLQSSDVHHMSERSVKQALRTAGITPSKQQLERMLVLADKYRTYDKIGKLDLMEFLKIFINDTQQSIQQLFLHSWYTAGRNSVPYNRPADIDALHDFVAGTFAGVALTVVGHPFDTIKVRLQTESTLFSNAYQCLYHTIENEGLLALFKGMSGPMSTIPLVNAITFWAYGQAKDVCHKLQIEPAPLNITQISLCGGFAGALSCLISCPVELVKTRLQIQYNINDLTTNNNNNSKYETSLSTDKHITNKTATTSAINNTHTNYTTQHKSIKFSTTPQLIFTHGTTTIHNHINQIPCTVTGELPYKPFLGPVDCIKRIYDYSGIYGLYRGMAATIYREVPGFSIQFGAYEALKRWFTPVGDKQTDLSSMRLIAAGGTAGLAGWIVSYPQDYIKSQLQAEPYNHKSPWKKNRLLLDGGFFDCAKQTVQRQGYSSLYRGFSVCAIRAFPANAAGFFAYEGVLSMMKDRYGSN